MANFLVVCGGAGRGILRNVDRLGFDATLQVDVNHEILPTTDGHSFRVDLPVQVASHISLTNVNVMHTLLKNIDLCITEKYEEITNAEHNLAELTATIPDSSNSIAIEHHKVEVRNRTHRVESLRKEYQQLCKRREHTKNALRVTAPAAIISGMSQAPCIGRSYVEDEKPTTQICQALDQMIRVKDANDPTATFWVIASICGGTGQGIYTHVIDQIHNVMQRFPNIALKIKVVRVGSSTYATVSPTVNLNAFWSVLTDYGYIKTHAEKSQNGELQSQLNYYYLDLPVVGEGGKAIQHWQAIVPSAFRALTQKHIDRQFDIVFNNMIGAPKVVLARIGEWGKEFRQDSVYEQTIMELQQKLTQLLTPEPAEVLGKIVSFEKSYNGDSSIDIEAVSARLTPQVISSLKEIPRPPLTLRVSDIEQRAEWSHFANFVEQIQPTRASPGFHHHVRFRIDLFTQSNLSIELSPSTNRTRIFNEAYIREVELAQITVAKFDQLITSEHNEERIYHKLVDAYNALRMPLIGWLFSSDKDKKEHVLVGIQEFLVHYTYVSKMLTEYKNATKIIDLARHELSTVTNTISNIRQTMFREPSQANTKSVALHDSFGGTKTWLQIIDENLRGNLEVARRSGAFRRAVQMGARSLTETGLKQVLNVPENTSIQQMVDIINYRIGSQDSIWWQGIVPNFAAIPSQFRFNIRLFPQLPEHTFAQMQQENLAYSQNRGIDAPVYIESDDNRHDFKIYGVECIAAGASMQAQFNQLIRPFLGIIQTDSTSDRHTLAKHYLASNGTPVYLPAEIDDDDHGIQSLKRLLTVDLADCVTVVTDVA
jgi:hypothetical protein